MAYDPFVYWNSRKNPNSSDIAPKWLLKYAARFVADANEFFELGPGTGRTFDAYSPGQIVTTLDLSKNYREELQSRADSMHISLDQRFLSSPTDRFPFEDGSFDLGVCLQVLMHVPPENISHTLGELSRVCSRTVIVAGVTKRWENNPRVGHVFNHDYLRLCCEIGCVAHEAFLRQDCICFVLQRADAELQSIMDCS